MADTIHEEVHQVLAENPHIVGAFDWSKLVDAVRIVIPVVMQLIALFGSTPRPTPAPTPSPDPVPTPGPKFQPSFEQE